ncbi:MAG: single-stranded-DNA-specific exonuclease RecJ [Pseudomonadota bacterium]
MPEQVAETSLSSVDPLYARLYASRGVRAIEELDYALASLAPIGSLENLDAAVELLLANKTQKIVIVGDFDVDGATSTALLIRCFAKFGFDQVEYLVPNRFDYGYGLTPEIVEVAAKSSPDLIITVDNGISSIAGVAAAKAKGIAVLITDHHLPAQELPAADVIVNPNLDGSTFVSRNLAGVGVAFYLMAALGRALEHAGDAGAARVPATYLDLVALGTVADVVPLDHNNRILVQQGLARIQAGHTIAGIRALLELSGRRLQTTQSSDLGFVVGPRINAAGRLDDIGVGIECLLTDTDSSAAALANTLDGINRERREIESDMREQAFAYVDSLDTRHWPPCVCLFEKSWHQGVVGLIAARVRERCHRPVIAFARDGAGALKGSMRSIPGVHARDLLEAISSSDPGLMGRFGGHAMAAGLSLDEENFRAFSEAAARQMGSRYADADFSGAIVTDGPLPDDAISLDLARSLRDAGPWGSGFPEPLWNGKFTVVEQRTVGEKHLKLRVQAPGGDTIVDAIAFNQAGPAYRGLVELAYRLDVNEFRGVERAQLVVEQISSIDPNAA